MTYFLDHANMQGNNVDFVFPESYHCYLICHKISCMSPNRAFFVWVLLIDIVVLSSNKILTEFIKKKSRFCNRQDKITVKTISAWWRKNRTFFVTLIKHTFENENVLKLNGIDREDFKVYNGSRTLKICWILRVLLRFSRVRKFGGHPVFLKKMWKYVEIYEFY